MAIGAGRATAEGRGAGLTGHAEALLQRCRPIDLHSDALLLLRRRRPGAGCAEKTGLRTSAAGMAQSHYGGQVLALFANAGRESPTKALQAALRAYDRWTSGCATVHASPAVALAQASTPGHTRAVLAIEGAEVLGDDPQALARLAARGLFAIAPVWNRSNRWADGAAGPTRHRGLSAAGRSLVQEAGRLGILLDISHAADATASQILALSRLPVVATHSNARAIHRHRRNLTDGQIRAVARSGGLIGINFHCDFILPRGRRCDVAALLNHIRHLRKLGGDGVLALGSDFDGHIRPPRDLRHAGQLINLVKALLADGQTDSQVCALLGDNVRRLLRKGGLRRGGRPQQEPGGSASAGAAGP